METDLNVSEKFTSNPEIDEVSEIEQFFKQFENPDSEKAGRPIIEILTGDFSNTVEDFPRILDIMKSEGISGIQVNWSHDSRKVNITFPLWHNEGIPFFGKLQFQIVEGTHYRRTQSSIYIQEKF